MQEIVNSIMLNRALQEAFTKVLEECLEELLNEFKDIIDEIVYTYDYVADTTESGHYWQRAGARTYQIRDAWFTDVKLKTNFLIEGVLKRPDNDDYGYDEFQHNNISLNSLDEVLNGGLVNVDNVFHFPKLPPRQYIDEFQKYVDKNLPIIFERIASKYGLQLKGKLI